MLRLTAEQAEALDELLLKRHAVGIGAVLAEAWPLMTERLKERWPAFVEAALLQGRRHGAVHPHDLARYASLWCIWGPSFEDKPGFEWAAEIVADAHRAAPLKVHQLVHRSRDELLRRQPGATVAAPVVTLQQFDAALLRVDRQADALAAAKAVFPDHGLRIPIKACDVAVVDMMVAEVDKLQEYRPGPTGWQRAAVPRLALPPLQWTRAPAEPVPLEVLSHALRAGPAARLNLKIQAQAVCDARVHPQVLHVSEQGRLTWKGRDAERLSLALYALALPPPEPPSGPDGIAAERPGDVQRIEVSSCGLRDAGAPFGDLALAVKVVPATQWLTELRHPAWPALAFPIDGAAPAAPAPQCRLEADGAPRDAAAWQRGWLGLHRAAVQGLEKCFNAWSRALQGQSPRLEAELAPLVGQAGVSWGWRRIEAAKVAMRTEGQLDLLACSLDLRLSGELAQGGARSRITLSCKGRSELRLALSQLGDEAPEARGLAAARREWQFPFTVDIEPLASGELATLSAAATPEPMRGAVAGECGLRPRPDGLGWQWFFSLRVDAVKQNLVLSDPVIGNSLSTLTLLPAMSLIDWSCG